MLCFFLIYMTIWQCRCWFGSAWSSWFGLVWHFTHVFLMTSHIQATSSYISVYMVSLKGIMSHRRWLEGTWYKAVMTYFRVFIWTYWGESQKSQPDQLVSCLRFKPVASKVHVRSVNAQANLISNSCHGDVIWHRKSLWLFLSLALLGLRAAPVSQRFLVSLIICKTCSKIWA